MGPLGGDRFVDFSGETHCAYASAVSQSSERRMAFSEQYYLHLDGGQKGPYTFAQLKGLYDKSLIAEETLYWRDGLDQWQPVTDLCGPPLKARRKDRRKKQMISGGILVALALFAASFFPLIRDGWKEAAQDEFTAEAAYWKARGYIRQEVKTKHNATVSFDSLDRSKIELTGKTEASAIISGTIFPPIGSAVATGWRARLQFDPKEKEWRLGLPDGVVQIGR
jgi:hypothetical protein